MRAVVMISIFFTFSCCAKSRSSRLPFEGEEKHAKMILIPAGEFIFGCNSDKCSEDDPKFKNVFLDEYYIDKTEVTVEQYLSFYYYRPKEPVVIIESIGVGPSRCNLPAFLSMNLESRLHHPMNCINWNTAQNFCRWKGKRLPTEQEWEKAARGTDGRQYPWGDSEPDCNKAVFKDLCFFYSFKGKQKHKRLMTKPVCSTPEGKSPFGLCDTMGNVEEWVLSRRNEKPEDIHIAKGGSFADSMKLKDEEKKVWSRTGSVDRPFSGSGFRCAWSKNEYNLNLLEDDEEDKK
ncbi:MAG: hypothetical protein D6806_14220 [Deltaproteobacteria bacterium]|nr:MAG: hypothetical protein D6806_14220 [Deltaproteobacteria bacterium]